MGWNDRRIIAKRSWNRCCPSYNYSGAWASNIKTQRLILHNLNMNVRFLIFNVTITSFRVQQLHFCNYFACISLLFFLERLLTSARYLCQQGFQSWLNDQMEPDLVEKIQGFSHSRLRLVKKYGPVSLGLWLEYPSWYLLFQGIEPIILMLLDWY